MSTRSERFRTTLDFFTTAALLTAALAIILTYYKAAVVSPDRSPKPLALPERPLSLKHSPTKGDPNAPLGLVVFSDFQCRFCRRFAQEVWPEL
jgi:protein-disulfide isomerase